VKFVHNTSEDGTMARTISFEMQWWGYYYYYYNHHFIHIRGWW